MLKLDMNSSFKDSCILCHHPGKHLLVQHKIIPGDPFFNPKSCFSAHLWQGGDPGSGGVTVSLSALRTHVTLDFYSFIHLFMSRGWVSLCVQGSAIAVPLWLERSSEIPPFELDGNCSGVGRTRQRMNESQVAQPCISPRCWTLWNLPQPLR